MICVTTAFIAATKLTVQLSLTRNQGRYIEDILLLVVPIYQRVHASMWTFEFRNLPQLMPARKLHANSVSRVYLSFGNFF